MWSNLIKSKSAKWVESIYNLKSDLFKGISEKEYMYLVHSFMPTALTPLLPQIMK
jgi:glutamine amidotransferase